MKGIMIVAHPDDEALWGVHPLLDGGDWTVLCITRPLPNGFHPERYEQFTESCIMLGAHPWMLGYCDVPGISFTLPDVGGWDKIVTHNEYGEYGHEHHKAVHKAVCALGRSFTAFGWGITHQQPTYTVELSDDQYARKMRALTSYEAVWWREVKAYHKGNINALRTETFVECLP